MYNLKLYQTVVSTEWCWLDQTSALEIEWIVSHTSSVNERFKCDLIRDLIRDLSMQYAC